MAQAAISLSSSLQARNPDNAAALKNEWIAATYVWVSRQLNSPKQRRLHGHLAAIEHRLRIAVHTLEASDGKALT